MKQTRNHLYAAIAALATITATQAAVTVGDPPTGDFYMWQNTITVTSATIASATVGINVGAWSYDNLDNATPSGWGHTSTWFFLEIQQSVFLTISMAATTPDNPLTPSVIEADAARPGFVLYGGSANLDDVDMVHVYNNDGSNLALNSGWDSNPLLTYVTHGVNASGNTLSKGIQLDPGQYTLIMGNAAKASLAPGAPSFDVTFAVPEPSAALLSAAAGLLAFKRRRR